MRWDRANGLTESMMRATNEWNNFGSKYGGNGVWLYDANNASIAPFFYLWGAEGETLWCKQYVSQFMFPPRLGQY